jgi:small-conductance mechanosensitive channel
MVLFRNGGIRVDRVAMAGKRRNFQAAIGNLFHPGLRLVLIRNQFVYRVVAVFAWSLAALSILGLLQPTMTALDSVAIPLGGVRVTPLLVIKTIVLLMLTLWAASASGDFLDRRVRSVADLTPSIQVLIGKLIRLLLVTFAILIALSTVGIDSSPEMEELRAMVSALESETQRPRAENGELHLNISVNSSSLSVDQRHRISDSWITSRMRRRG